MFVVALPSISTRKVGRAIAAVGPLTLGIYLIDPCLKLTIYGKYLNYVEPVVPMLLVSLGWVLISMVLGGLLTALLKKIPVIKKII